MCWQGSGWGTDRRNYGDYPVVTDAHMYCNAQEGCMGNETRITRHREAKKRLTDVLENKREFL